MAYTTIDKPSDYFNTVLYTGTGADNRAVTGVGFQPDWLWIKDRSSSFSHALFDVVRGSSKMLVTQGTEAEQTNPGSGGITSFDTNGFTTDAGSGGNPYRNTNQNNDAYVSWNWKAGTSFSNSAGANGASIASTGSISTTAGFSIISFTGDGNTGAKIAHGLGVKPDMIILKMRSVGDTSWGVYHKAIGATKYLRLNNTGGTVTSNTRWNNIEPTSTVFTLGSSGDVNQNNATIIAYCFADVQGYSKMGSYVGNGSDTPNGVFVYLGFTPAYILIKATDSNSWVIVNNKSPDNSNPVDNSLAADSAAAETTGDSNTTFNFLSNGFKTNGNSGNNNSSGQEYVFMAFAQRPFVTSTGVPATAR